MRRSRGIVLVAWALLAFALALVAAATVLSAVSGARANVGDNAFVWAIALGFGTAGVLIATRHPGNSIGWLFLGVGVAAGLGRLAGSYADYWLETGNGSAAIGRTAAWYGNLGWIPFILLPATFLLLLFPDGRLRPGWSRPIAWLSAFAIAILFLGEGLHGGRLADYPQIKNPYGVEGGVVDALEPLGLLAVGAAIIASALSLVRRFRSASHDERRQMKWLAFAGAVAAATFPLAIASYDAVGAGTANGMIMLSILGIPAATGIAILRHRLYDIDVVINRTLVYGALTATLAAAYLGSILFLQLALSGVTGGSGLAVAASTLAVAALFRPARARIQAGVDRRFYRQRYDAAQTLERFGTRLRDEVDLGALSGELRSVVAETMQPAHVSVWLRSPRGTA